jgi:hypothetical protein
MLGYWNGVQFGPGACSKEASGGSRGRKKGRNLPWIKT